MSEKFNFEEAMSRLQEIADALEKSDLPLDESIRLFEEGLQLSKMCQQQLKDYEKKVSELVKENQEGIQSNDD